MPTSVWSKQSVADIHQIYTRLSLVKEEQTPAGTTQSELKHYTGLLTGDKNGVIPKRILVQGQTGTNRNKLQEQRQEQTPAEPTQPELKHYTDLFKANKSGVIPKRILVQGQTGIGKSTFVKKLLVDWVEVNNKTGDEQATVLKNFELVVAVNLKEVSKCQSLKEVIRLSNVFAKEDKYMTEGLVKYISNNQEKVLLIFDGYDEYRIGRNSEIYEIFSGNSLRSCCVLITTRISRADELREGAAGTKDALYAEITGFSEVDRKDFMRRFLDSEEVSNLQDHLKRRKLDELAKVPLLLLFFCTFWKRGQSKHFPKTKTSLYMAIVQFILDHRQSNQSPPKYDEVASYKEILSEIGKVALQGLLKDDHLFEYSQLSDSVRCDESVFIGLLQITDYTEAIRPVGMVSFIHKSIQEFLAAWYITYRCITEDGELAEIGVKFEECMALEDVFPFVCGLSHDGALATFRHLKSVRMSDPALDLSKTVPDEGSEADAPLSDVTDCQREFSDLVSTAFEEVESKAELSRACLDSLGSILLVSESFPDYLLVDAIDTNTWSLVSNGSHWYFGHRQATISRLYEIVKKLITQGSEVLKVAEFLDKFVHFSHCSSCDFSFVLCFRNGQVYLYITHLTDLLCDNHARLITDNIVSSQSVQQSSGHLSLKFLKTLENIFIENSMKSLGAAIKNCNHLEHIEVSHTNSSLSHILKHVPNPRRCSLSIGYCSLTSKGAVELASLLPKFERVIRLSLSLAKCSAEAVTRLVASIKHNTIEDLELSEINLTTAAAEALSQSLSELSALQKLEISGVTLCSAEAGTRLFAGIKHKTLQKLELREINLTTAAAESLGQSLSELSALQTLWIRGVTLCSAEAGTRLFAGIKHKTLEDLELSKINLTTAAAESLGKSLSELPALQNLEISGVTLYSAEAGTRLFAGIKHKTLEKLELSEIILTTAAAESLGQSLPELSALKTLWIRGVTLCSAEAATSLFAGIKHETLEDLELSKINLTTAAAETLGKSLSELPALQNLEISGVTFCSAEAATSLFAGIKHKTLEDLELSEIILTTAAAESLGQSLPELSALRTLRIHGVTFCSAEAGTRLFAGIKHKTLEDLLLTEINLTTAAAESLGQSLPELSALQTLKVSGLMKCSDDAVTRLITAIKHETLEELELSEMNLTPTAVVALGQSLRELPSLQDLKISGSDGSSFELRFSSFRKLKISGVTELSTEAVTRLIDVIKQKPLEKLELSEVQCPTSAIAKALGQLLPELSALQTLKISSLAECPDDAVTKLVTAVKHKTLNKLDLCKINLTLTIAESLAQSLAELPALQTLTISGLTECSDEVVTKLVSAFKHTTLEELELSEMNLKSAAAVALGQSLSELPSLQKLEISGSDGCSLQLEFPVLRELKIKRWPEFFAEGLTRLIDVIKHKPLEKLKLSEMHLTSAVGEALGQLLPELSALQTLKISGLAQCSDDVVTKLVTTIKHKTLEKLALCAMNLTSTIAESLAQSLPELTALRTLKLSGLIKCSDEVATRLGAVIKHKTLEKLDLSEIHLTSALAESLGQSLPELSALRTLKVSGLIECSDDAVTRLVAAIKHKTLEELALSKINPTSAAAVMLNRSLPELHFLQELTISGLDGFSLQLGFPDLRGLQIGGLTEFSAAAVTRLIDVIKNKPIEELELSKINLTSAVAEALGHLMPELSPLQTLKINGLTEWSDGAGTRFFAAFKHKTLKELDLSEINVTSAATEALGQSLPELSALQTLKLSGLTERSDQAVTKLIAAIKHKTLEKLELSKMKLTSVAAEALGQSLPQLTALRTLMISGLTECSDEAVTELVTAIKHKTLETLELSIMKLTSAAAEALSQALPELSALQTLKISGLTECSGEAVAKLVSAIKHKTLEELELSEMNLTSTAALALGQSLSELPFLQNLTISGSDGCSLKLKFSLFRKLKISGVTELSAEAVTRLIDVIKQKPLEKLEASEVQCPTSAIAKAFGQLLPELSALQTLKISSLAECPDDAVTKLVTAIKHKTLNELDLCEINLTLIIAESLAQSLPELSALQKLTISGLTECSDEAVTKLVSAIKHTTLEELELSEMNLTSAAAVALGQSLPELPSLQKLEISGSDGCSLQLEFPVLRELKIKRWPEFSAEAVTRLINVIKHKPLEKLELSEMHLTSAVGEALGQLLPELSALQTLKISGLAQCSDDAVTKLVTAIKHKTLEKLTLCEMNLTSTIAESLAQSLPELRALRTLKLSGLIKCSNEVATRLGATIKHKTLEKLDLGQIHLTSAVAESLGQSLPELSALRTLKVSGLIECSDDAVTRLVAAIKHKTLENLELGEINPMSAVAEALSQSLPELSALRTLKISISTECSDNAVTKLVAAIKHKTLEELELSKVNLTSSVAEVLRQSLSELSALESLSIGGMDGCSLQLQIFDVPYSWRLSALEISGCTECSAEAVIRLIDVMKHKPLKKLKLSEIHLTSAAAEALSQSLPELSALRTLKISSSTECSDNAVTKLVAAIKHKTLEELELSKVNMTSSVAEVLRQSLSELSALRTLKISSSTECSDNAVTKLVAAIKHKTLEELELSKVNLTSSVAEVLRQSLSELSALRTLKISSSTECSDNAVTKLVAAIKHKTLEELELSKVNLTSSVAEVLRQLLSELSALKSLSIGGMDGCSLQLQIFDVPYSWRLSALEISGCTECSAEAVIRLIDEMKHKPLKILKLSKIHLTSAAAEALSQSLPELSALQALKICGLAECSSRAVTSLVAAIKHKTLEELELSKVNLTSSVAEALSQSLPELSALRTLKISSSTECSDNAVTKLVAAIKHKTLEELELSKVNLTSSVAEVLRQSLSELSALESLSIGGMDGCSLQLQIFDVPYSWRLSALEISGCTECSAEAVIRLIDVMKHKPLKILKLSKIHLTSAAAEALSQSLPELSALQALKICGLAECSSRAVTSLVAAIKHKTLEELELSKVNLTSSVAEVLRQSLPELSALRTLKISSSTECSDNAVTKLVAAIKHKTLEELELSKVNLTSSVAEVLRQSLSELSALKSLSIGGMDGCSLQLQIFNSPYSWQLSLF